MRVPDLFEPTGIEGMAQSVASSPGSVVEGEVGDASNAKASMAPGRAECVAAVVTVSAPIEVKREPDSCFLRYMCRMMRDWQAEKAMGGIESRMEDLFREV